MVLCAQFVPFSCGFTLSLCFMGPAFGKRDACPRVLPCYLFPFARCLSPSEKELASCCAGQLCEIATEEVVHFPSKPRVERSLRRGKLSDQLAQRPLGVLGFQENDRRPSTGRLRCKPHGLRKDAQLPPRFRVAFKVRAGKLLQETPPGLFFVH